MLVVQHTVQGYDGVLCGDFLFTLTPLPYGVYCAKMADQLVASVPSRKGLFLPLDYDAQTALRLGGAEDLVTRAEERYLALKLHYLASNVL